MPACPFFETGFIDPLLSEEKGRERLSSGGPIKICWCDHREQVEFNEERVRDSYRKTLSRKTLQCDGDLKKCTLTEDQLQRI